MKHILAVLVIVVVAGVYAPAGAEQTPKFVAAEGSLFLWLSMAGTATCIGGEPTGTFPPCTPGTKQILWRDFVGTYDFGQVTGEGAGYLGGQFVASGNCNLDARYQGRCWGTFEGQSPAGGQWAGIWNGEIDFLNFGSAIEMVGHGSGSPQLDGLQLKISGEEPGTGNPYAPMLFTARIHKIQ